MDNFALWVLLLLVTWICTEGTILDVRLAGGNSPKEGRVEINADGDWNTICGSSWDMNDVIVTCRQLGFSGAQLDVQTSEFGSGTAPQSKQSLFCKGNEETLNDCSMQVTRCTSGNNVAGAVCHGTSYLGCYGDNPQGRPLSGASYTNTSHMSIKYCLSFCDQRGFEYAGLEYGSECYCGSANANYSMYGHYRDSECRHTCAGNRLETCGGIAKMAVHIVAPPSTLVPSTSAVENPDGDSQGGITNTLSDSTTPATNTQQQPLPVEKSTVQMMTTIVYVLAALLVICSVTIIGCIVWNCKLRSRLKKSYDVSERADRGPTRDGALPYMVLERRPPPESSNSMYQGLSVQRKQGQAARGRDPRVEGAYATSILMGDPVYQEPAVYMEPDQLPVSKVGLPGKPAGEDVEDNLLGGGNDYEMFGT